MRPRDPSAYLCCMCCAQEAARHLHFACMHVITRLLIQACISCVVGAGCLHSFSYTAPPSQPQLACVIVCPYGCCIAFLCPVSPNPVHAIPCDSWFLLVFLLLPAISTCCALWLVHGGMCHEVVIQCVSPAWVGTNQIRVEVTGCCSIGRKPVAQAASIDDC